MFNCSLVKLSESGINYHCESNYQIFINLVGHSKLSLHLAMNDKLGQNYIDLNHHDDVIEINFIKDLFIALGICITFSILVLIFEILNDLCFKIT